MCSFASEENDSIGQVSLIMDNVSDVNMVNDELCGNIQIEQDNGIQRRKANKGNVQEVSVK